MLWSSASRVIVEEIASLRTYHVGQVLPQPGHELELRNSVEKLVTSISIFAPWSPLMGTSVSTLYLHNMRLMLLDTSRLPVDEGPAGVRRGVIPSSASIFNARKRKGHHVFHSCILTLRCRTPTFTTRDYLRCLLILGFVRFDYTL